MPTQFETAVLVAPGTYELSGLLRGQAGTEHAMVALLPAGARFVLIDGALARIGQSLDELGLPFNWKIGPSRRDIGDTSYVLKSHAFRGEGLKPLSPVHLRGVREVDGSLTISWVRRTRVGGDTWEPADTPLGEINERYEVDILEGTEVRRTLAVASASASYTAAEQILDFGSVQPAIHVRVSQLSGIAGRGAGRLALI